MFNKNNICYLCRETHDYYSKLVLPDANYIRKFFPAFKEDVHKLCQMCFAKFRKIFEEQYPSPPSLTDDDLPSPSFYSQPEPIAEEPNEEQRAAKRKRILDEIKKAM